MSKRIKSIPLVILYMLGLVLIPNPVLCQKIITGKIVDKETLLAVSYASVGLIFENTGTSSDVNGKFTILSRFHATDSIRVSCVGYKTSTYRISEISDTLTFFLEAKAGLLKDVIINSKLKEPISLNEFNNCSLNYYHVSLGAINQIAILFEAPKPNMVLGEINLCKQSADALFRIRIYGVDSATGSPLDDLSDTVVTVNSSQRNVTIDLTSNNIFLPEKAFFIAVEWLFIPENAFVMKTKLNGTKYAYKSYNPGIGYVTKNNEDTIESDKKAWVQNFNGKWKPIDAIQRNLRFLISAKVK